MHVFLRWAVTCLSIYFLYVMPAEKKLVPRQLVVELKRLPPKQKEESTAKVLVPLSDAAKFRMIATHVTNMPGSTDSQKKEKQLAQAAMIIARVVPFLDDMARDVKKPDLAKKFLEKIFEYLPDIRWNLVRTICVARRFTCDNSGIERFTWKKCSAPKKFVDVVSTYAPQQEPTYNDSIDAYHPHGIARALSYCACWGGYCKGVYIHRIEDGKVMGFGEQIAVPYRFRKYKDAWGMISSLSWNPQGTLLGVSDWEGQFTLLAPGMTRKRFAAHMAIAAQAYVKALQVRLEVCGQDIESINDNYFK